MNRNLKWGIVIIIAVALIAIVFFDGGGTSTREDIHEDGAEILYELPNLSFTNYNGAEVSFSDFSGKPLVINAWATWCPFCVNELSDFVKLQKEFDDIVVIAINRRESPSTAKEFTDSIGISDDIIFLMNPNDSFYQQIGGFAMPETIFVNADGGVVIQKRGFMTLEEMSEKTQELLADSQ